MSLPPTFLRLCSYPCPKSWRFWNVKFGGSTTHPFIFPATFSTTSFRLQAAQQLQTASPLSGLEDAMIGYITGKRKATEVAHSVWKQVIRKGDVVVDATCGNGHDTLALLNLVKDDSGNGCVYGFDIQEEAINKTLSLLDKSLVPTESPKIVQRKHVELFAVCHSRMMQLLPKGICVRLVAFNLGYLPGSDKTLITKSSTTLLALEAAKEMLAPGGLISAVVYVGHPGGSEEFDAIKDFAFGLSAEEWACLENHGNCVMNHRRIMGDGKADTWNKKREAKRVGSDNSGFGRVCSGYYKHKIQTYATTSGLIT